MAVFTWCLSSPPVYIFGERLPTHVLETEQFSHSKVLNGLEYYHDWTSRICPTKPKYKEHSLEATAEPTAAKTKRNVEMNSARYALRASGFIACSKRDVSDAIAG